MLVLLVFCGPPTLEMAVMRPATINFNPMRPLGQFEFETPALKRIDEIDTLRTHTQPGQKVYGELLGLKISFSKFHIKASKIRQG
jgi:hypothetical protein